MPAPARGCLLYCNLLALGAYSSLPARSLALGGRGERRLRDGGSGDGDGTSALQAQREGQGAAYDVRLSFVITGFDYASLAGSDVATASLSTKIADSICGAILLPAADCQVTLSAGTELTGSVRSKDPCHRERDSKVVVEVIIAQGSLKDAEAISAEIEANKDSITSGLLLSTIGDTQIMEHLNGVAISIPNYIVSSEENHDFSHPGHAQTMDGASQQAAASVAPFDGASAQGDPHLASVTGQKFDVNMPGSYVLIRVPQDRRQPSKLEMNATLQPNEGSPCGLYIKSVELGGEWLGGQVASVVPLQRNVEGENGAGNRTLRPFSVRVRGAPRGGAPREASGAYEQWGDFLSQPVRSLSGRVRLVPVWRQVYADADRTGGDAGSAGLPVQDPGRRPGASRHAGGVAGGPPGARRPPGRPAWPRLRAAGRAPRHGGARSPAGAGRGRVQDLPGAGQAGQGRVAGWLGHDRLLGRAMNF
ncbi:unnamed protein product [Prorocentrum cordatum]|uniref:Uncharacterized protein n=1 Tax=Prorocentrum cordatum TaxID=2364126 RepID=A0ABN9UG65_9DINO|nr:unnamed protein product [Polarella glacialis]